MIVMRRHYEEPLESIEYRLWLHMMCLEQSQSFTEEFRKSVQSSMDALFERWIWAVEKNYS